MELPGLSSESIMNSQKTCSQQKLASQMPRGTRIIIDSTGTRLEVKGARNYTSYPLYVGTDEIFEDIVIRGIRSDGFSSKLGVKNNKTSISKLISDLFKGDQRQQAVIAHFNSKRQRSNAAKTVFATMTQDELKLIHSELIPLKVDLKIRHRLHEAFPHQAHKLRHCAEVLQHLQTSFSNLDHETELLSIHNFQCRGFFADTITSISNFLMQVVDDAEIPQQTTVEKSEKEAKLVQKEKEDETAAEILLSVGSAGTHQCSAEVSHVAVDMSSLAEQCLESSKPSETGVIGKNWTQVEIVDGEGQQKCFLVKTPKEHGGGFDEKLVQFLNNPTEVVCHNQNEITSNSFSTNHVVAPFNITHDIEPITTLEISLDENPPECLIGKRPISNPSDEIMSKRMKS